VTLVHAFVPVVLVALLAYAMVPPELEYDGGLGQIMTMGPAASGLTFWDRAYADVWPVAIAVVCFGLLMVAASGTPSYLLHPRTVPVRQQNAAIALSYYACGPLALAPAIAIAGVLVVGGSTGEAWADLVRVLLVAAAVCVVLFLWWLNVVRIARRTLPQAKGRWVLTAVGVPALWLVEAGLVLVGIPYAVLFVLVVMTSLG
jgi:hypothetical protein